MKETAQSRIKSLEKCIAMGDIPGMAQSIEQLRAEWGDFDDNMKKDIQKLESIFLSMVHASVGGDS